jgi:6-phosphogluconate dehydrogenase
MNEAQNDIGLIGLGTMGRSLVLNMADHGFAVGAFNRTTSVTDEFAAALEPGQNVKPFHAVDELLASLKPPRRIMLMVDAGKAVDAVLGGLDPLLRPGDIVIDGGNSFFKDTDRRAVALGARGVSYLGVGVSGGESGARFGPSMMPGGPSDAYDAVHPIFEAIAAKADGASCVTYLGPGSSGHYVKMVHNGIEYGLMQLISESYALLKQGLGLDNDQIAATYAQWQAGELESYLTEITAAIFKRRDDDTPGFLVDRILGEAAQKGTGMWTSQNAMDVHVPVPNIDIAVSIRNLSGLLDQRTAARRAAGAGDAPIGTQGAGAGGAASGVPVQDHAAATARRAPGLKPQTVRDALYAGIMLTYMQGFAQLQAASAAQGYGLVLRDVASIWRGGCIIRSAMLREFRAAFERQPDLANLLIDAELSGAVRGRRPALAAAAAAGMSAAIPVPGMTTALGYLDAYLSDWLPTNLIQAQRDYFGAHTYRRIDREGVFHTDWSA